MSDQIVLIEARNPSTVCCPEALLVAGLRAVGVEPHPKFPFRITEEQLAGEAVTLWRWPMCPVSRDGIYRTADLVQWWHDDEWLADHPLHEWALVRTILLHMGEVARGVREAIPRAVVRRGELSAHIPANASPERRQWLLDRLEGRLPLNAPFPEPAPEVTS